jgi:UDP-hydrolysing UDP-N-acetyl-D-glucosamine 2-epimerase
MPSGLTNWAGAVADRRVAVITGTRADYGLLHPLLTELRADARVELQLIVTGSHLSPEFGLTVGAIEADGFPIAARCDIVLSGDTPPAICTSMGLALIKVGDVLARLAPDVLVVLGDRYEALAAATAALICRVPIAHLQGGESTEGAIDEALRHAITKMANLHFVAAQPYARRVVQLGEDPERVFAVGSMAYTNLQRLTLLERDELERELGMRFARPLLLVTYHASTLEVESPSERFGRLLAALEYFGHASIVLTKSNADTGGRGINALIDDYAARHMGRVRAVASLGQLRYLSLLRAADAVVGNSSSGIIEAPLLGTPTVNVGDRQRGRLRTPSIVDCADDTRAIVAAIDAALRIDRTAIRAAGEALYGMGGGPARIVAELLAADLERIRLKSFGDLAFAMPGGAKGDPVGSAR